MFGGIGAGFFVTSANSANELRGPFNTLNINIGLVELPIQLSVQIGWNGDTVIVSATAGPGDGLDVSLYQTNTVAGTLWSQGVDGC